MQGRDSHDDELARRRAGRRQADNAERDAAQEEEEELPKLGWRDTLAMIIAAYQVLFPIILAMFGTLAIAYLLFRWYFT